MNKQEYWRRLSAKNPNLKCDMVRISSKKIKAIVFNAFDHASKEEKPAAKNPFDDLFH
jgi:hypothetical protein